MKLPSFAYGIAILCQCSAFAINLPDNLVQPAEGNLSPPEAFVNGGDGAQFWALTEDMHGTGLNTLYARGGLTAEPITMTLTDLSPDTYRVGVVLVTYRASGLDPEAGKAQVQAKLTGGEESELVSGDAKYLGQHHSSAGYDYDLYLADLGTTEIKDSKLEVTFINGGQEAYIAGIICRPSKGALSLRTQQQWPKEDVPETVADGAFRGLYRKGPPGDHAALRADFDAVTGALIHLGVDTEGGGREKFNLLRSDASIPSSADSKVTASTTDLVKVDSPAGNIQWEVGQPAGTLTMEVQLPAEPGAAAVNLLLPLNPVLCATTILGGQQQKDGSVRPPFLINAPDLGLLHVRVDPPEAGVATFAGFRDGMGSRFNKLDLTLTSQAAPGGRVKWTFEPILLPPPEGMKNTQLWPAMRRGWLNALQTTAPWGNASSTVSAPAGLYANNVLSDLVSGLLYFWGDHVLLSPPMPEGIDLNDAMRRAVDYFLDREFELAAADPRLTLIRSAEEIAALGSDTVRVSAAADGVVPCYHSHIQMFDGNAATIIGAWNVWRSDSDNQWLTSRFELLEKLALFLVRHDTDGDGLVESANSGNEGTFAMEFGSGSTAYDAINSGHKDAYVNVLTFRAWNCLAEMAAALGKQDRADFWHKKAGGIKTAFLPEFFNPETGWLGWWRSRDGVLHDYASPPLTGMAVMHGLITPEQGRPMLEKLWAKIDEVGFRRFDLGVPTTLIPFKPGDYHFGPGGDRTVAAHQFQHFLNGGCTVSDTFFFLTGSQMALATERASSWQRCCSGNGPGCIQTAAASRTASAAGESFTPGTARRAATRDT